MPIQNIEDLGDDAPNGEGELIAKLVWAFLDGHDGRYKRNGVGTEAIRFFVECTGYPLELPENDGMRKQDGSHLTGDGAAFVEHLGKLKKEGGL